MPFALTIVKTSKKKGESGMDVGLYDSSTEKLANLNWQQLILLERLSKAQTAQDREKEAKIRFELRVNSKAIEQAQREYGRFL